jgi:hypothetical protein
MPMSNDLLHIGHTACLYRSAAAYLLRVRGAITILCCSCILPICSGLNRGCASSVTVYCCDGTAFGDPLNPATLQDTRRHNKQIQSMSMH